MIIVREQTGERQAVAIALAYRMVKKTGVEHTIRVDQETQRWFVHPRWRVHPPDGQTVENDSYFGLGDWRQYITPQDRPPPLVSIPELG